MPANLTLQYLKAEQAYRQAESPADELAALQTMLRELPKHKGTDKLQADLKQKISRAKVAASEKAPSKKSSFRLPRQGAGRVLLIGGPNAGKSQLLASVTKAQPEIASYPFTTIQPLPGMMPFEDVMIQMVDTPPITKDVFDPVTQGLIRSADIVYLMMDLGSDEGVEQLGEALEKINSTKTRLGKVSELDENDIGLSRTQTFLVPNKIDDPNSEARMELLREFYKIEFETFPISAQTLDGVDNLKEATFKALDVVRVYTKQPHQKEPDFEKPFTLKRGGTLLDVAELIHKDVAKNLKTARVWGSEVHDGTVVRADYVINDRDIVEIHT